MTSTGRVLRYAAFAQARWNDGEQARFHSAQKSAKEWVLWRFLSSLGVPSEPKLPLVIGA